MRNEERLQRLVVTQAQGIRCGWDMIKRKDEGKLADSIRQAAERNDMQRYIAGGHSLDIPNGDLFDDLLKRLDEAETAQTTNPLGSVAPDNPQEK